MKQTRRVPLTLKLLYTAFVALLVPCYWHAYGPQNFLYFCDLAALVVLVGLWTESRFLLSLESVAILLPQTLWLVDFLIGLTGHHLIHMTDYMRDPSIPLFVRGLSLFHGWMPLLLVWSLTRVGYDRRAFPAQILVGVVQLLLCYAAFAPPDRPGGFNVNYVYGLNQYHAQTALPPLAWLGLLLVAIPTLMYLPTHLLLRRWFAPARVRQAVTSEQQPPAVPIPPLVRLTPFTTFDAARDSRAPDAG